METTQKGLVPQGLYKGRLWSEVPEGYLYFIVNAGRGSFADACRQEVIRRRALSTPQDPWAEERGPLTSDAAGL